MTVTAVIGLQWGDEAKGKFVDLLSPEADLVARFNGGDNAGHTVVNELGTFKLRLTPNGFANPQTQCVIGPGVVVNLHTLISEIKKIEDVGIELRRRLWISPRCNVVMPYHPLVESVYEEAKGLARTGTTRRGMGPVFADKASYNGILFSDLANEALFSGKLKIQLHLKNVLLKAFGAEVLDYDWVHEEIMSAFRQVQECVREPFGLVQEYLSEHKAILLEGAQGALLDNTWGTYPFCTASTTTVGGACAGLGIAPRWIDKVVGVAKAYTTRVGAGPMPTEDTGHVGRQIQEAGQEYGTVTGRPRRCGWFDAELVRFTCRLNGVTDLALTKLDVLDGFETIKICTGYTTGPGRGATRCYWEVDAHQLDEIHPVYEDLPGWMTPTTSVRHFHDLPHNARAYVQRIEALCDTHVSYVSVGPERDATIRL